MIALTLFATLALALTTASWLTVRGQSSEIKQLSELQQRTRPVDVLAFMNLVNPDEDSYLRQHLPYREYRFVKRLRIAAALDYMEAVRHNASVLIRLGEALRTNPDQELATRGNKLLLSALQMRVLALAVSAKLSVAYALPGMDISAAGVIRAYEGLTAQVSSVCRLKLPEQAGRILARL